MMKIRKIICLILFHKLRVVHSCTAISQKLLCLRCKKYFGIHHGVKTFIPWDAQLEEMCESIHPTPTPDKLAEAREILDSWYAEKGDYFYPISSIVPRIDEILAAQDLVSRAEQKEEDAEIVKNTRDSLQGGLYNNILKVIFDETIKNILNS